MNFHQFACTGSCRRFTDVLIDSSGALVLSLIVVLVMHTELCEENVLGGEKVNDRVSFFVSAGV